MSDFGESPVNPLVPTIFHEDWWLDLASHGQYQVAEVLNGGRVIGRLPYLLTKRAGFTFGGAPRLCHFVGPAIDEGEGTHNTRFIKRLDVTRELLQKLPPCSHFEIKCHRDIQEVIAFQDEKYQVSVQFTHEILPSNEETLWKTMRHERRRVITRALETNHLGETKDVEEFARFYEQNLADKQIENNLDPKAYRLLAAASLERHRGKIWAMRDKDNQLLAAVFCVWDAKASYYLMTTRSTKSGNGDVSALIWEAMKDASARNLIFDLDGLASAGGVLFYAGFGATIHPRYIASKSSLWVKVAKDIRFAMQKSGKFH